MTQWNEIYKKDPREYTYYNLNKPHKDMPKVARIFKKKKVQKVLDLGCGSGRNFFFLHEKGFTMSGIDLAPEGIKTIKRHVKADLRVGDVFKKLPYADDSFDAVVSVQVLQHARERNILRAIKEIRRILKPGGLLFVTVCGRIANGVVRYCLVKTARQVGPNTYIPTAGNEKGLVHFIYNKKILLKHYKDFKRLDLWKDGKDYYCLLAEQNSATI